MSGSPVPNVALDHRLGFTGTTGSGKTYGAGTCVERLLDKKARVLIPDPLGVWYGLRLDPTGKEPSPYDVVIFGGPRGDLPINEHAGALIGETCATMKESAIIDLSEFGTKAAERRFMLAFLQALYRKTNQEPVHLIFDEADMWAPERLLDKEGEAAKLLGMMETIVRRGRIKGFIPWLITQRPAVLSKNVLSQVDGLVSFKLTSSQDRKALGAWVEGQADEGEWKGIYNTLPTLDRGHSIVWLPTHGVLKSEAFPEKKTFDSSRAPRRGEKRKAATLKPLDLPALKERLATVEAETRENDPNILRQRIRELEKKIGTKAAANEMVPVVKDEMLEAAQQDGYRRGVAAGYSKGWIDGWDNGYSAGHGHGVKSTLNGIGEIMTAIRKADPLVPPSPPPAPKPPKNLFADAAQQADHRPSKPMVMGSGHAVRSMPAPRPLAPAALSDGLTRPQQKVVDAIAWFEALQISEPTRTQVAAMASYSPTSGGFNNLLGQLNGPYIAYPRPGYVALTDDGRKIANPPAETPTNDAMHQRVCAVLNGPQARLLSILIERWPDAMTKDELAGAAEYSPTSGGFNNLCGRLRTLGLVDYPSPGSIRAEDILFPENRA